MRYDLDGSLESSASESVSQPAPRAPRWGEQEARRTSRAFLLLIVVGLLGLLFVANFRVVVIEGNSMEPTYHHGQRVLMTWAYWLFGPIRKGDVVVIQLAGGARLVKRVVALGGEEVPRQYWGPATWRRGTRVPPGYVYVVGDNLERSEDSRQMGPFPLEQVQGKVVGGFREMP
ncbi:MAG: signal peptidase I [Fimbriimonadales bacterium]|nr:signal peptidase I [Fimbriimonadales bacterium]